MRAILLDWLNEVCEVYKMYRETYYLAVDYIDRYLSRKKGLMKTHLQLLGVTALFIAAKVNDFCRRKHHIVASSILYHRVSFFRSIFSHPKGGRDLSTEAA